MIKFSSKSDTGEFLVGLGLSRVNVEKLLEDNPIMFEMEPLGLPKGQCLIFFGETEKEMAEMIKPYIGKNTSLVMDGFKKVVVSTMSALALVMLQPLFVPWLGQFLLERGL